MAPSKKKAASIDAYISDQPKEVQARLRKIRQVIRQTAPGCVETISYGIPTMDLNGRHLVHFAAFKNHIGFFPTESGVAAFKGELADHRTSRGTIQLPQDRPIPLDLVRRIVKFRVDEVMGKGR